MAVKARAKVMLVMTPDVLLMWNVIELLLAPRKLRTSIHLFLALPPSLFPSRALVADADVSDVHSSIVKSPPRLNALLCGTLMKVFALFGPNENAVPLTPDAKA